MVQRQSPEERELEKKREELETLQDKLAERELDLATVQADLRAFEHRYQSEIGSRYARLDEIEARIAEAVAEDHRDDTEARTRADEARERAEKSAQSAESTTDSSAQSSFQPSEELKSLYREAAKKLHPDMTTDSAEQARRHELMADLNAAYEKGDETAILDILSRFDESPDMVEGEGVAAELVRTIRKIAQVKRRLEDIDDTLEELRESELYSLYRRVEEASSEGRNLLDELAADLDSKISNAKERAIEAGVNLEGLR